MVLQIDFFNRISNELSTDEYDENIYVVVDGIEDKNARVVERGTIWFSNPLIIPKLSGLTIDLLRRGQ
ncbi:MAG: hypothetical protein ACO1RX_23415 [Candidatus Sericytochromatia bacterium]